MILPEHILKDVTKADVEKIDFTVGKPGVTIGTGPYKLTAFTADQSVELEANPDYFKGAPKIQQIIFKLFADPALAVAQLESGDLDLAFRVSPGEFDRLSAIPTLNVISAENPGIVRIVFKTEAAPWSDKRVRQAFYTAINRQAIVDEFYKGRAKVLYNPPGFTVYDDLNKYDYNVDTAKQLLTDGGYNGETFKLLYNQTFPDATAIMPLIQSDLQAAGMTVELVPTDNETYLAKYNDRTQWDGFIAVGGSEALSPDRSAQYFPKDGKTESGYTNPRIFELWAEGRSTADASQAGRDLPRAGEDPQRGRPPGQPVLPEPRDGGLEAPRRRLRHPPQRARDVHGRGDLDAPVAPRAIAPETDRGARRIPAGAAL